MTQSGSRKRGRCDGEDESRDFTPLSKRINNLHINNGTYCENAASSLQKTVLDVDSCDPTVCNGRREVNMIPSVPQEVIPQPFYRPDLSLSDNPFYYESNKLLYYLYVERMQRSGQPY